MIGRKKMSVEELINLIKVLAVDNYDMQAPAFAKLLEKQIIEIFKQREQTNESSAD